METTEYTVCWQIEIIASSREEAAKEALAIQRDPSSEALVFDVYDAGGVHSDSYETINLMTNVLNGENL